ncbi:urea ABC transporter substrate-binding protein [Roseateles sp. BYS78W]|uniref:Urea ABC transporter substrate-binding protein n=1 Tax=Pelomonas candidula TaxID=3299025 RepID=A0ABW7H7B1_9BURK
MRVRLALLGALILLLALALGAWLWRKPAADAARTPIVIGLIHALTGPLATSEQPLVAAVKLAVDEINQGGGLLGRRVELRIEDTRSLAAQTAADAARRLIDEQHAVALFGCWSSGCRQAVRPVVEERRHLLFYPMAHEGVERSPNIVYTGPTPNQQVLPAADWAMQGFGRRVYLVGTDGLFPRRANAMLRDFVQLSGGQVLGERYVPLTSTDVSAVITDLRALQPDLVLNTLNGDGNRAFFDALVAAGLTDLPLLSFTAAEPEMRAYGGGRLERHFTAWGYLQSLPGPANTAFLTRLRALNGADTQAGDPAVSAYVGVRLWAAAVRELGSDQTEAVNANVLQQSVEAPYGFAAVDAQTRRLWRPLRVAQVRPDGQLVEVWQATRHIRPAPWPAFRSAEHWNELLAGSGARP